MTHGAAYNPGESIYEDNGCLSDGDGITAPSCLDCPYRVCKHDMPLAEQQKIRTQIRDAPVMEWLRDHGIKDGISDREAQAAAAHFGYTIRTIYRTAKRSRDANR